MITVPERILPVVVIDELPRAVPLARALIAGGISTVEVTLRTAAGVHAIAGMCTVPGLRVGAGTVRNAVDVKRAAQAGAQFLVSPGLSLDVIQAAKDFELPILPGIATATEAQTALNSGLSAVKVFPAGSLGGPRFLRSLSGPFPELSFWPSGGIGPESMDDYLDIPSVAAVCGSWMVDRSLIESERWADVERLCRASLRPSDR